MRLRRLGLENYGNFPGNSLELDDARGVINVLVAPNGFGKSVLRRAISELLFGIQPQTPMGFQFGYDRMRLVSSAVFPDGEGIAFARRKGRTNTLTDPGGKPAHASLPSRLPREAERKRLERLFVLDSAALRDGGKALLQTDGDLADALLSSAGDLGSARTLAADFAARRDAEAPERRRGSTPFYEAGDEWTAATTRLAATVVRPAAVEEQDRLRVAAVRTRDAANAQAAAARADLARLARIRSTRRHLHELDEAAAWLEANAAVPALPPGAGIALERAKSEAASAVRDATEAGARHVAATAALAAVATDPAALAEAAAIERLSGTLTQSATSRTDIPKREAELAAARAAIGRLLRELSSPCDPADAAAEVRAAADIATARALIAEHAALSAAVELARREEAGAREKVAQAEDDLAALPALPDTEALAAALAEAVAEGEPARQAQAAQAAEAEAAARLAAAVARVPGWRGEPAWLAALPLPAEGTLARLDKALSDARAQAEAAEARRAEDAAALEGARTRLADLTGARPLPDAAAVAAARAHRDRGWALVFARLEGSPLPDAEAAYAGGTPLPLAFERAMAAADGVADRRAEEFERLATAAELHGVIARHEAALAGSVQTAIERREQMEAASQAWAAAVTPSGLPPGAGLAEVRAFLSARDKVVDAMQALQVARDAAAALAARQAATAAQLAAGLQTGPDTLPRLVAAATQRVKAAEGIVVQRRALTRTLVAARRAAMDADPALQRALAALSAWEARWADVLARLRRPADEAPAVTTPVLDRLILLPAQVEAADTASGRLAEMRGQLAAFAAECAAVAARLGEEGGEADSVARRLAARLKAARAADAERETLARQLAAAAAHRQATAGALVQAEAALQDAIGRTGAALLADAEARVALDAERLARQAARTAALNRLAEDGDGRDVATLRAEAAATPPDAIAEATAVAEAQAASAGEAAQAAAADAERAEGALRTLAAGQGAAHAASDRQAAAARLSRVLEDALVQHLAAVMLGHGLQAVEAIGSSNDRLARIGQTFARLTGGAYTHLSPAPDGKDSDSFGRLLAHEAAGAEKHVGELSEGTRDQLYLALRLVAVEDHVQHAPPLPFVADDILQTFDDTRARAALEALVGLSQHVQVILLTHHPHLLHLAQGLPVHQPNWDPALT